jgi:hypothetical protein
MIATAAEKAAYRVSVRRVSLEVLEISLMRAPVAERFC